MESNWSTSPLPFIPGLRLNEGYYRDAVRPLLERFFPDLPHTAALVGYGSDVLGFDTPMSRDHMWGPRLVLFLEPAGFDELSRAVDEVLRRHLPLSYAGYPTHFSSPDHEGVRRMQALDHGPVEHLIFIHTVPGFIRQQLGVDLAAPLGLKDWLVLPQQKLLAVTAGRVFQDDLGLEPVQRRFAYYPRDLWLYLLACQWGRIGQEEAFVGRTGDLGDALGSQVIAARLVHDLMRLAFLMERRYAPYSKWFGSAFRSLEIAPSLAPVIEAALAAGNWQDRQARLAQAYELAAERQNALGIAPPVDGKTRGFFGRPFQVLFAGRFAEAIRERIEDAGLRQLPLYGSVDQFCTTTDILESPEACERLRSLYG